MTSFCIESIVRHRQDTSPTPLEIELRRRQASGRNSHKTNGVVLLVNEGVLTILFLRFRAQSTTDLIGKIITFNTDHGEGVDSLGAMEVLRGFLNDEAARLERLGETVPEVILAERPPQEEQKSPLRRRFSDLPGLGNKAPGEEKRPRGRPRKAKTIWTVKEKPEKPSSDGEKLLKYLEEEQIPTTSEGDTEPEKQLEWINPDGTLCSEWWRGTTEFIAKKTNRVFLLESYQLCSDADDVWVSLLITKPLAGVTIACSLRKPFELKIIHIWGDTDVVEIK